VYTTIEYGQTEIYLGKDAYFDHKEFLLGNSALSASLVMV